MCWEPSYPLVAHDNRVFLHMWFSIECGGSGLGSAYLRGGTELMAVPSPVSHQRGEV